MSCTEMGSSRRERKRERENESGGPGKFVTFKRAGRKTPACVVGS